MSDATENRFFSRRRVAQAAALGGMWPAMGLAAPAAGDSLLDVRKLGAKGDGKTDDTKAIQSAIDGAAKGGAVFVPPGTYLSGELQLRPYVGLIGIPAWDYRAPGGSVIRLADPNAACLLNITAAFGTTIEGLSLEGGRLGKNIHGVLLNKKDYGKQEDTFRIERAKIANFSGDGVHLSRAWCFSIRHSMVAYNGGDGIRLRGWDGFLMDNWLSGNRGAGFGAREENASCTLTANRIEWNREGVVITGGDGYNITGNFFDRAGTSALELLKAPHGPCEQMTISGNFFKRSGKSADPANYESSQIRWEGGRGITCCANNFQVGRDDGGEGVYSPSYGIVFRELQHCVISNNVLRDGAIKQLLLDLGGHEGLVLKDNPGCLFQERKK